MMAGASARDQIMKDQAVMLTGLNKYSSRLRLFIGLTGGHTAIK